VANADVRPLLPRHITDEGAIDKARWRWRTPYGEGTGEFPEDGIHAFLRRYGYLKPLLIDGRDSFAEAYACIVIEHGDDEFHRGYSFSAETIRELAACGLSLEVDAVSLMSKPEQPLVSTSP
jgi:hypothetical protein